MPDHPHQTVLKMTLRQAARTRKYCDRNTNETTPKKTFPQESAHENLSDNVSISSPEFESWWCYGWLCSSLILYHCYRPHTQKSHGKKLKMPNKKISECLSTSQRSAQETDRCTPTEFGDNINSSMSDKPGYTGTI